MQKPSLIALLFCLALWGAVGVWAQERQVAGWLEWVVLEPYGLKLKGKLDTGAKTSSLHAVEIERFQRDGEEWVRFKTLDPRRGTKALTVERPLVRNVKIKRHAGIYQERPVVALEMCLGDRLVAAEFSLIDRRRFNYPVLLGRSLLKQEKILVDASATYVLGLHPERCRSPAR